MSLFIGRVKICGDYNCILLNMFLFFQFFTNVSYMYHQKKLSFTQTCIFNLTVSPAISFIIGVLYYIFPKASA